MNQFTTSKAVTDWIREQVPTSEVNVPVFGAMELHESNIFPFEIHYHACDIETHAEIKIPSGIMCHGYIAPKKIDFEAIGLMTPPPEKGYHPYLDYLRESIYGYQFQFMSF